MPAFVCDFSKESWIIWFSQTDLKKLFFLTGKKKGFPKVDRSNVFDITSSNVVFNIDCCPAIGDKWYVSSSIHLCSGSHTGQLIAITLMKIDCVGA